MSWQRSTGQAGPIRVLIVPGPDPIGDWVAATLKSEADMVVLGIVRDLARVVESLERLSPDVILVDTGSGIMERGELLDRLAADVSRAAVIVMAVMNQVEVVRQATLRGAQGFLLKPFSEAELLSSVRQAHQLVTQRRAGLALLPALSPGAEPELQPTAEIICVYSPKGGVGCTTIATNLAVTLRRETGKSTILVDADLGFGDIDTALNITSNTSMSTLLSELHESDDLVLDRNLVSHHSGIRVLLAPPYLEAADAIPAGDLRQLLARLASMGDGYIVVDAWSTLEDRTLAMLDMSHHLLVVATPQLTALRDVHRFLEVLHLLRYEQGKVMLILNNCYHLSNLRPKEVERSLGRPITQTIEYAPYEVTASLNRGVPLVQEYPDSPIARSIVDLARKIASRGLQQEPEAGRARNAIRSERSSKSSKRRLFRRSSASAEVKP